MDVLKGKRFELETASGTKTGTITSEPFRDANMWDSDEQPVGFSTCVSILWDDGRMEGAIDVEDMVVIEKDEGYVVCATWPDDEEGEVVLETWMKNTSREYAETRMADRMFADKKPRLMRLIKVENNA